MKIADQDAVTGGYVVAAADPSGSWAAERVVVGVDNTPGGIEALRWAVSVARAAGAELIAVRAWALGLPRHGGRRMHSARIHPHVVLYFSGTERHRASSEFVRRAFQKAMGGMPYDLTVTIQTPEGEPGAVLAGIASSGDLLVLGADQGRHFARRLVHGSVSRYCRRHARCPVVVVPAGSGPGHHGTGPDLRSGVSVWAGTSGAGSTR